MRKLLVVLLISFAVAHFIYLFFENAIEEYDSFSYPKLNEIINGKTNYDILFMGTSRTQSHLNPCIIDPITHLNSYNAGTNGSNSLEVRMLLEAYLASHKPPAYIFYNIEALTVMSAGVVPIPTLYLFFLGNEHIAKGLATTFRGVSLLQKIPFLRVVYFDDYTRNLVVQNCLSKSEILQGSSYCKGHVSTNDNIIKDVFVDSVFRAPKNADISEVVKVIGICKRNNIRLIFHSTPVIFLNDQPIRSQRVPEIDSLAEAEKIQFIRFDTSKAYLKNDFKDFDHLNRKGSEKYSRMFAKELVRNGIHK